MIDISIFSCQISICKSWICSPLFEIAEGTLSSQMSGNLTATHADSELDYSVHVRDLFVIYHEMRDLLHWQHAPVRINPLSTAA